MPTTLRRPATRRTFERLLAQACGLLDDVLAHCVADARVSGPAAERYYDWRAKVAAALGVEEEDLGGGDGRE